MSGSPLRRNRDFVLLQIGQLLSSAGTGTATIAYPLLVLALTHSPAKTGVVSFVRIAPFLVFGLLAGAAADRWSRKRLMVAADAVRALAVASLAATILLHAVTFWQILAVAFVEGAGAVLFDAAESGALRAVVPPRQLPAAASAEQARASAARLAAPPVGGALFGVARALPFVADAATYVLSTASVLAMRTPFQEAREPSLSRLRARIAEGLGFLWSRPFLRASMLMISFSGFSFAGGQLAIIVLASRRGLSGAAIGGFVALVGASTLLGSLASPLLRRLLSLRLILLSEFWAALPTVCFFVWPSVYVLAGAFATQAFFFPNTDAAVQSYRLAVTPDRLVGRVNAASRNLAALVAPLGPLAAGLLLAHVTPRETIAVFTGSALALAVWGTLSPSLRDVPSFEEAATAAVSRAEAG